MTRYIHHYKCPECAQEWTQDSPHDQPAPAQFCPDLDCGFEGAIGPHATLDMIDTTADRLAAEIDLAATKAIDSLARYKFQMFGYWAGIWVHLNRLEGKRRPSPFKPLVMDARCIKAAKPFDGFHQEGDQ